MFTNPNENLNSKSSWKSEHKLSQLRRYKTSKLCRGKTFIIFGRCSGGIREDIRSENRKHMTSRYADQGHKSMVRTHFSR